MKLVTLIAEEGYAPQAVKQYRSLGPVYFWFEMSAAQRARVLPSVDILVVRLALTVSRPVIDTMPKLKIIATSTTGLNHIDGAYAQEKGIEIISLRGHTSFLRNIPSTAEETFGLLLALVRQLPWAFDDVKEGKWNANRWTGHELKGKTIGLIGLGRLGTLVAGYARAFGMNVIACDPNISAAAMTRLGVRKVTLQALCKVSDIVSLHVPLTDATTNFLTTSHFKSMKPTSYFINTARAEIIAPKALHTALTKKWIAGAAIDVLHNERDDASHLKTDPLFRYAKTHENLIIVPHIGGTTFEAKETTQNFIADLVLQKLR